MSNTENLIIDEAEMEALQLMLYVLLSELSEAAGNYAGMYEALSQDKDRSVCNVITFQSAAGADTELHDFFKHLALHTTNLCNFTGVAVEYIQRVTGYILDKDKAIAILLKLSNQEGKQNGKTQTTGL